MKNFNISYLLILIISLSWALSLDLNWSTDFGVYYTGAASLSENYRLYAEHFDHKGPSYYFFLKIIGSLIGFGPFQAMVTIFLTSLLFCVSVSQICKKFGHGLFFQIIMILCSGNLLHYQSTNSSIALFQGALLLWTFYFLKKQIDTGQHKYLIISITIWSLSFYTRVDSILFAPLFLFSKPLSKNYIFNILILICSGFLIFSTVLFFYSNFFTFEFYDFFQTNIVFNKIHGLVRARGLEYFWYRPESYKMFMLSGLPFVTVFYILLNKKDSNHLLFKKAIFPLSVTTMGLVVFLITNNDRVHHSLIFLFPMMFSIILFFKNYAEMKLIKITFLCLLIGYPNILSALNIYSAYANIRDGKFLILKSTEENLIINEMKLNKGCIFIGERAWFYLFSGTKPDISVCPLIYNKRYEDYIDFFDESISLELHQELLSKSGQKFIIKDGDYGHYTKQLIKNSTVIKTIYPGTYLRAIL